MGGDHFGGGWKSNVWVKPVFPGRAGTSEGAG